MSYTRLRGFMHKEPNLVSELRLQYVLAPA